MTQANSAIARSSLSCGKVNLFIVTFTWICWSDLTVKQYPVVRELQEYVDGIVECDNMISVEVSYEFWE